MYGRVVGTERFRLLSLIGRNREVFGFNLGNLFEERGKLRDWMTNILTGVQGWVRPFVGKTFWSDQVAEAHKLMESRGNTEKVVLVP